MQFYKWKNFFVVAIMLQIFATGISFALYDNSYSINQTNQVAAISVITTVVPLPPPLPPPPKKLTNPPEIIMAVYVTQWSAGNKSYLNYLSNLFKTTEINAVVVDVKDSMGRKGSYDANSLVRFFHEKNIYIIGRISVFEDPTLAKARPDLAIFDKTKTNPAAPPVLWQDNNKLSWLDPSSKEVWDYNISIAKDALLRGFDEINFDYIRFPSDGKTQNMGFPFYDQKIEKRTVLKNFFEYLRQELPEEKISADLFGQATVNSDDLGIGQIIEDAFEYFDYVCPMVYPSHYATNFMGFKNPAEHPYEVVKYSLDNALLRIPENSKTKLRPWLQSFNMGAIYTSQMVKAQIIATQDALGEKYNGYMLWSPSNIYTQDAIKKLTK